MKSGAFGGVMPRVSMVLEPRAVTCKRCLTLIQKIGESLDALARVMEGVDKG